MLCGNSIGCYTSLPAYSTLRRWALGTRNPRQLGLGPTPETAAPPPAEAAMPTTLRWRARRFLPRPCILGLLSHALRLTSSPRIGFHLSSIKWRPPLTTLPGDGQQTPIACAS